MQLLEQSPLAMDNVIFDDLSRDYDQRLDIQVVNGSGANGQHTGVLNVASSASNTSITQANYVQATATSFGSAAADQYRSIANGVNQIETLRYAAPTALWVHPRRSNSWAFAMDSNNRPLFVPAGYGPWNALGLNEPTPVPQGVAGELFGLPVVKDANMVTTANGGSSYAGTGGTQDPVVVVKEDDLLLYEGTLRLRALPEILSGTLQIRFQVYAYSAFVSTRFPPSISIIAGAGVAAPSF
jgi:HK97 family phage major capsid protein